MKTIAKLTMVQQHRVHDFVRDNWDVLENQEYRFFNYLQDVINNDNNNIQRQFYDQVVAPTSTSFIRAKPSSYGHLNEAVNKLVRDARTTIRVEKSK